MTNRVAIDKAIRVESVSGPAETLIVGAEAPERETEPSGASIWGRTPS